jgi:serine/threonine-protein kinase
MEYNNPYIASATSVIDLNYDVPEEILKKIKNAWVAALVSATFTLVLTLIAISGTSVLGFSAWEFLDVGLILGLALGIYKKSRTCAVLMLVYFVISKIILMVEAGKPNGIILGLVFIYYYWQGVVGTFAYHKIKNSKLAVQNGS